MGRRDPLILPLRDAPAPAEACARLLDLPAPVLLESAAPGGPTGRYSIVAADPVARLSSRSGRVLRHGAAGTREVSGDVLSAVAAELARRPLAPVPGLPPFLGGAIGFLAYEWGTTLERIPRARHDDLGLPDAWFGIYDQALIWDHVTGECWLVSTGLPLDGAPAEARARTRAERLLERLGEPAPRPPLFEPVSPPADPAPVWPVAGLGEAPIRSTFRRDAYEAAVARVRDYVLAGDIFQANLSQRFELPFDQPPFELYRRLRAVNPAPFAAWLDLGRHAVVSASPERFLALSAEGEVETRPIKGTRRRGDTPEADAASAAALLASAKDRAENVMIVDLLRNDLSRVCRPGSVRVPSLCALDTHPAVHHLVSTVTGRLEPGRGAADLLRAAFPGGSITGAPKVRAMEIIAELEPTDRGVYCGAIGWWSLTGALDTSIAIRTCVVADGRVTFGAGGGITAASDPAEEYEETLDKARGLSRALAAAGVA